MSKIIPASMYCVTCRQKQLTKDYEQVTMKNGSLALKGKCPVCGTWMFRLGGGLPISFKVKSSKPALSLADYLKINL